MAAMSKLSSRGFIVYLFITFIIINVIPVTDKVTLGTFCCPNDH